MVEVSSGIVRKQSAQSGSSEENQQQTYLHQSWLQAKDDYSRSSTTSKTDFPSKTALAIDHASDKKPVYLDAAAAIALEVDLTEGSMLQCIDRIIDCTFAGTHKIS